MFPACDYLDLTHTKHGILFPDDSPVWAALTRIESYLEFRLQREIRTQVPPGAFKLLAIATQLDPTIASDQRRRAFGLPLTRGEMADFLGLTIETVSRQLSRLRKDGIIDIAGPKQIEIPDLPRLRARCG